MSENDICGRLVRFCRHGSRCGCLAALLYLTTLPARGGAYLPLIGPPTLRFATAASGKESSWTRMPSRPVAESSPPPAIPVISAKPVTAASPGSVPTPPPPDAPPANPAPQVGSANEMLVVSPDMLVDYFKQRNNVASQSITHVLTPVNFLPPPSTITYSSQATYKTQ